MHPTKQLLIERNGLRCMLCGREVSYREIEWHHIIPKSITKFFGLSQDDSYDNGALLCLKCHKKVHEYFWEDEEYKLMMEKIQDKKIPP